MSTIRKALFWCHLAVGLVAGGIVFLLCLTGAVLSFELQIIDRAERTPRVAVPETQSALLPPEKIVEAVGSTTNEKIQTIEWFADPQRPVRVQTDQRKTILLNGYTGEVLGAGAVGLREFMRWNTTLHTNLTTGPVGHLFVAWGNVGFVFLCLSGLWIWWPRVWRWSALRHALTPRFDVAGKTRDWNWHNAFGIWALLPLLFIATTGVVLSFRAADQWWRGFGGTAVLGPAAAPFHPSPPDTAPSKVAAWPDWLHSVQERHPGWRSISVFNRGLPNKDGVIPLRVNGGTFRQARKNVDVKVDPRLGQIVEERTWSTLDGSNRARSIARLGHSGEFFGSVGQFVALLACLAGMLLVYTGVALSWRRFFGQRSA